METVKQNWELEDIIEGCKSSDRRAQEQLFKKFYGKMLVVCQRYIRDKDSAQEVLQEGFIKVFEHIKGYDKKGSFEGWMRRIIVNCAIDSIRKSKKDWMLSDNDNDFKYVPEEDEFGEEWEITTLKAEFAMEAINKLSPAYKAVFNLYVMEEFTHKEIAEILEISEGTSKSNLAKAKMNLQNYLKQKFTKIAQ
ncbi:RNA polymerase sigma factor [Fluviicola chungangensis]|uniref:RNA polymerase sigma factor n=1 Tax=Fluviicola chungangensis TaxID=2597671 RepID=A0A556MN48_9FLAO|nr:RNA polymerase sigma factor [Fluviicola chungangensis]